MTQDSKVGAAVQNLVKIAGERAMSSALDKVSATAGRLTDYARNGGGPGLISAVTGRLGDGSVKDALSDGLGGGKGKLLGAAVAGGKELLKGGGRGGGGKSSLKVTNIVERLDVGVPVQVAYNQWTQFADFPKFMKKVESVEQESPEKLKWRAQVLWSHRDWESTILEQVPDRRIVWRSKGAKGHVDGAVTFHEIAPELTRIVLVLEYHPQGFFEHTGNLWRAQGRRARLEFKHFGRHVMTQSVLHPDEITGWRGEIRDGQVVSEDGEESTDDQGSTDEQGSAEDQGPAGEQDATDGGSRRAEAKRKEPGAKQDAPAGRRSPAVDRGKGAEDAAGAEKGAHDGNGEDAEDGESARARPSRRPAARRRLSRPSERARE